MFQSYVNGWACILAGSWFISGAWPGWLLELWRPSGRPGKASAEDARQPAGVGELQVRGCAGTCAGISWRAVVSAPARRPTRGRSLAPAPSVCACPIGSGLRQVNCEHQSACSVWLLSILTKRRLMFAPPFFLKHRILDYPPKYFWGDVIPVLQFFYIWIALKKNKIIVSKSGVRYHFKIVGRSLYLEV